LYLFSEQTPPPAKKLESPPKVLKVEKVEESEKHPNTIKISNSLIDITPIKQEKEDTKKSGKIIDQRCPTLSTFATSGDRHFLCGDKHFFLRQACQTGGPRATCGTFACFVRPK